MFHRFITSRQLYIKVMGKLEKDMTPEQVQRKRQTNKELHKKKSSDLEYRRKRTESCNKWRENNREKNLETRRQYNIKNRLKNIEGKLKNRFNLTVEQYNEMFNKQNGCCAICGIHQKEFKMKLCVDHDHETKEIRGLLCKPCNLILGNADDNIDILISAIKYLENV